jgi:hypothetical protein
MYVHDLTTLNFQLDEDVAQELNDLNSKGIDVSEILRDALKRRREEISAKKDKIAEELLQGKLLAKIEEDSARAKTTSSRYIPAEIKQIIQEEHGEKCSIAYCFKRAETIHHTQRFGLSQNHDPHFLAPLCREHHAIAHSIDNKYQEARAAYS